MRIIPILIALVCLVASTATARAQDWVDFKGQFTFVGKIPARKELKSTEAGKKEVGVPADHKLLDESLLVHEKNGGIANILIWVIPDPDKPDAKMPIHPSYEKDQPTEHVIKMKNLAYSPRVSAMQTGVKLKIENDDLSAHLSTVDSLEPRDSARIISAGRTETFEFKKQAQVPTTIRCNVHPHERAYLLVRDNPYFAVTNEQGVFEMKNLPVGEWRFKAWHEKAGYITEITIGTLKHPWPKGEFKIKLEKTGAFLGAVELSDKLFDK